MRIAAATIAMTIAAGVFGLVAADHTLPNDAVEVPPPSGLASVRDL